MNPKLGPTYNVFQLSKDSRTRTQRLQRVRFEGWNDLAVREKQEGLSKSDSQEDRLRK